MNLGEKLLLGLNTTIICMGIVFLVLIILSYMIVLQSKILNVVSKMAGGSQADDDKQLQIETQSAARLPEKAEQLTVPKSAEKGSAKGETKLVGVEDEEHVAAIMAAISDAANVPLSNLRIKSIKRVDETWNITSKQEQTNQRL